MVWAVAKGSALNKLILVPAALLISAFAPWLITPLLMAGGLFLCYEGFEKVAHKWLAPEPPEARRAELRNAVADEQVDMVAFEKEKIRGAIRTDFILSAEIIVITLGTVAGQPLLTQVVVLSLIAVLMTIGVYGLVAGIVKLDDLGRYLVETGGSAKAAVGRVILRVAPYLMKFLSIAGTAAMFLVGGGILAHGIPGIESWLHDAAEGAGAAFGTLGSALTPIFGNAVLGIVAGGLTVAVVTLLLRATGRTSAAH